VVTIVAGALGTAAAIYFAHGLKGSTWDNYGRVMGLIGGGFAAMLALGLLTTRASSWGVLVGSLLNTVLLWTFIRHHVHWMIYGTSCLVSGFVLCYLLSLLLPDKQRNLEGLTVWTPRRQ
jgi:hypothetical protein